MRRKFLSDIEGFENCSDYIIYEDGSLFSLKTNAFLHCSTDSKGYLFIGLKCCSNSIKSPKIHRLVMLAFSNEEPKLQINHKDGNKLNNHIENLEWCTNEENRKHAIETGLKDEVQYYIAQYDLDYNLLNVFRTCREALEYLGKNKNSSGNIGRAIKGKRKTAFGYIWKQYSGSTTIAGMQVHSSGWKQGESS